MAVRFFELACAANAEGADTSGEGSSPVGRSRVANRSSDAGLRAGAENGRKKGSRRLTGWKTSCKESKRGGVGRAGEILAGGAARTAKDTGARAPL